MNFFHGFSSCFFCTYNIILTKIRDNFLTPVLSYFHICSSIFEGKECADTRASDPRHRGVELCAGSLTLGRQRLWIQALRCTKVCLFYLKKMRKGVGKQHRHITAHLQSNCSNEKPLFTKKEV